MQFFSSKRGVLLLQGLVTGLLVTIFSSCGNTRGLVYLQGKFDTAELSKVVYPEPIIQKGDILGIIVYSDNPEATRIYNQSEITVAGSSSLASGAGSTGANPTSGGGGSISGTSPAAGGYMVDENGNIEFQGLGVIHVDSLTRAQLKDTLDARLKNFLTNPYYAIRFLNYKFTMLGEVGKPGVYSIAGDRISLFDALGVCGDMTFFARRDNILVIRQSFGKRAFARLDITKPDILKSPYFYLQAGDVVIVEPNPKKVVANDQTTLRNVSILTAIVSTFAILYAVFK
jgi:polysaccharide export outer membrane protein